MHPMLNIGVRAAHAAGNHILRHLDRVQDIPVNSKGRNDFVTEVDRQTERIIIDTILKVYPQHSILAEESGRFTHDPDYLWVIDPLDGTTNFLHGFPQFAVSIALKFRGQLDQAVVYDPLRQELFTASKGAGAYLNNKRIRVSKIKSLNGALLGTGFPFRDAERLEMFIQSFRAFFPMTAGIRRAGAAALDLAYVACGRLDGFWEFGLNEWDVAAGSLLILEAGGNVGIIKRNNKETEPGNIAAGNLNIFAELMRRLNDL
jgi:myo-inositol-1(or 4)-monophosphatase